MGSSTQISRYLKFLGSLVNHCAVDTDTIDRMLSQPHQMGYTA